MSSSRRNSNINDEIDFKFFRSKVPKQMLCTSGGAVKFTIFDVRPELVKDVESARKSSVRGRYDNDDNQYSPSSSSSSSLALAAARQRQRQRARKKKFNFVQKEKPRVGRRPKDALDFDSSSEEEEQESDKPEEDEDEEKKTEYDQNDQNSAKRKLDEDRKGNSEDMEKAKTTSTNEQTLGNTKTEGNSAENIEEQRKITRAVTNTTSPTLVVVPGVCEISGSLFKEATALARAGYRVLLTEIPVVWTHQEYLQALEELLETVTPIIRSAHFWGIGLGGYLLQGFAAFRPKLVESLVLTSSFASTDYFAESAICGVSAFYYLPGLLLREYIVDTFPENLLNDPLQWEYITDMLEHWVNTLDQAQLASRLTLLCSTSTWSCMRMKLAIPDERVTFLEAVSQRILPRAVIEEQRALYPGAKLSLLSKGGEFCYLALPDECAVHLQVHIRRNGSWGDTANTKGSTGGEPKKE
eukprot:g2759.t1